MDGLVKATGMDGISKSQVSRLCVEIDEKVHGFLNLPREGDWPHLRIHATDLKVRQNNRIVSVAAIIAMGVNSDGRREVLGLDIGTSEAVPCWKEFLRNRTRRGMREVHLVISCAHEGLKAAVSKLLCATWQRCRVHVMRNAPAHAVKSDRRVVSALIATAFAQDDARTASTQWRNISDQIRAKIPKLATLLDTAKHDVLACTGFPAANCTPRTPSSASMAKSNAAPGSWEPFRTKQPSPVSSAPSSWSNPRKGPSSARYMTLETMAPVSDDPIVMLLEVSGA